MMLALDGPNSPGASGGRVGASGEAPRGGPATFRLRADHTQLGRAVLICSLSQLAKPVLRSVNLLLGWGSHVRFRRVQTLVWEGSPLVNSEQTAVTNEPKL
jgi:hypothetical protein